MISEETILNYSKNQYEIRDALNSIKNKLKEIEKGRTFNDSEDECIKYMYYQKLKLRLEQADKKSFKTRYI